MSGGDYGLLNVGREFRLLSVRIYCRRGFSLNRSQLLLDSYERQVYFGRFLGVIKVVSRVIDKEQLPVGTVNADLQAVGVAFFNIFSVVIQFEIN